ncbi:MAG: MMPL family transporter [Agarilytica sp.]
MSMFFNRYIALVTQYPKSILFFIALLTLALAAGLPRFKLDASSDSLTLEHDEDLKYFREVSQSYKSGDFLVVTFRPEVDLFSDDALAILGDLKADLAQIDGVVSINSILDVPLLYSPKQSIREIVKEPRTLLLPGVDRLAAKQEFLTSPIYRDLILGPDGQTTALQLNLAVDETFIDMVQERDALRLKRDTEGLSKQESQQLTIVSKAFLEYRTAAEARGHLRVEEVRAVVAKYKNQAEIFVGGITMITADMITFIQNDLVVFGTAVLIFMVAILAIIFRNLRFVVIPMLSCMAAVIMMLGYVSWLDWRLTVISSNFVALLLIISLAIIIHLVVRYREYCAEHPAWSQQQLVAATVTFMARPCLYTALTTIVAFASLVVSDIGPVIDFGWMMTIGLVVALVLAFLLMPACLMLIKREDKRAHEEEIRSEHEAFTLRFSRVVENHGVAVFVGAGVVAILSVIGISRLQVENRFIDYFHSSTEIYQGLSVIDNNLGGTTSLDIIVTKQEYGDVEVALDGESEVQRGSESEEAFVDEYADESFEDDAYGDDPFSEAENEEEYGGAAFDEAESENESAEQTANNYWLTVSGLKRIEEVHDYLESLPQVGKVQSLGILYKVGKDINGGLNDFELALLTKKLSSEVKDILISPFVPENSDSTRITLRIHDTYPNLKRKALVDEIESHIIRQLNYEPEQIKTTGLLVLYNNMLQSLFSSQIVTLGAVFFGITLMFFVLFRSFVLAIVAIVPNVLAALAILGTMGLIGLPLDMMTITVAAITVGIGVDDTIHYIHRFKEEVKIDGDYLAAMHRAHGSIGRAMYYTSVIIVFGFGIMVLSEFIPTIYFGLLTGLAMFYALMGALLLLPKLILLTKPFPVR